MDVLNRNCSHYYCKFLVVKILTNMCFQRVLLNIKKNIVMENNISVQITSKKVLPNQFSFQFNTNLKIDKTKTFIAEKKTDIDFFY